MCLFIPRTLMLFFRDIESLPALALNRTCAEVGGECLRDTQQHFCILIEFSIFN